MRAGVCDPADTGALGRLRQALQCFNAVLLDQHESALGVTLLRYQVEADTLDVFADAWSVDVEGPDRLVAALLEATRDKSR